jgi:hypothetical protein
MTGWSRRAVLGGLAAATTALAGCERAGDEPTATGTPAPTERGTTPRETTAATGSPAETTTPGLDLREANVVGVAVEQSGEGYRFDVTLYHDDDGEAGYADWWQVETLAGERLGRRPLAHPHSTAPFTRSTAVSASESCVVVRGHDQTHGYGGQAMLVALPGGATRAVRQGPRRRSFGAADCP